MTRSDLPPRLSAAVEARIGEALRVGRSTAPFAAARVLALIVQLAPHVAFVCRHPVHLSIKQIAAHLGISDRSVSWTLRCYARDGWLTKRSDTGWVRTRFAQRPTVVSLTFYDPSPELQALIEPLLRG
jgi:DNA-binding transcriptional ArsR family regulator